MPLLHLPISQPALDRVLPSASPAELAPVVLSPGRAVLCGTDVAAIEDLLLGCWYLGQ